MEVNISPVRQSSILRSLRYLLERWILRRPFLVAHAPGPDLRFKVKTEDCVGRHLYKYLAHEPLLSSFLVDFLSFEPGDVVLDIGANVGWYSLLFEKLSPDGVDVFAFEPDPLNFELLKHNLRLNRSTRVSPVQKALAAGEGVQRLYKHADSNLGRHSLLQLQDEASIDVKTISLDGFWDAMELGTRTPRFIKIDIEGYELLALKGAERVLERCPALLVEFSPEYMGLGGFDPADLISLLTGHGYTPHAVGRSGLTAVDCNILRESRQAGDYLWLKR